MSTRIVVVGPDANFFDSLRNTFDAEQFDLIYFENIVDAEDLFNYLKPGACICSLAPTEKSRHEFATIASAADKNEMLMIAAVDVIDQASIELISAFGALVFAQKFVSTALICSRISNYMRRLSVPSNEAARPFSPDQKIEMESDLRRVTVGSCEITLSPTEYLILNTLISKRKHFLTREQIRDACFGSSDADIRTIDVHISNIRKKLGPASSLIRTIRSAGYLADY